MPRRQSFFDEGAGRFRPRGPGAFLLGLMLLGAFRFSNDQSFEGRAFAYHGSASGLSLNPDWTAESDQKFSVFDVSVGTAGDVDGDGYADVIDFNWGNTGLLFFNNPAGARFDSAGNLCVTLEKESPCSTSALQS